MVGGNHRTDEEVPAVADGEGRTDSITAHQTYESARRESEAHGADARPGEGSTAGRRGGTR